MNSTLPQKLFDGLELRIAAIANLQNPSAVEKENLWLLAVETYHHAILDGYKAGEVKKDLTAWLWRRAAALGKGESAINRQLYRKIADIDERGSVADKRREAAKKRRAPELSPEDRKSLLGCALRNHYGELDAAWRECVQQKKFSPELLRRYPFNPRRRVRCPRAIRRQFSAKLIQRLIDLAYRPRKARQSGPYLPISHDDYFAGDWRTSDDFTLELYFATGDPECPLRRGQFLPEADCRSKRILNCALVDAEGYRQDDIRRLFNRTAKSFGCPRRGYHLENGSWRRGKLVGGKTLDSWGEFESNMADRLGIRICHSLPGSPRGKIIENIGKLLQRFIRGELRWVGSDEKKLVFEHSQKAIADVRAGRLDARAAGFLTHAEWLAKLRDEIIPEYNSTVQQSIVYGGTVVKDMSPDEAWERLQPPADDGGVEPVTYLTPETEWLFWHRETKKISRNGIKLPYCGGLTYMNEATGEFLGHEVIVYFDLETPEYIIISDLKKEQFRLIERVESVPRWTATPDEMATGMHAVRAHDKHARTLFAEIKTAFRPPARKIVMDVHALETGRQLNEKKSLAKSMAAETRRRNSPAGRLDRLKERHLKMWEYYDYEKANWFQMGLDKPPQPPAYPRPCTTTAESCDAVVTNFLNAPQ